jgi:hypothetical protein
MIHVIYYNSKGEECEEISFVAKHMVYENGESFWIWYWKGNPYDVHNESNFRQNQSMAKLTRVSKDKFKHYLNYLKTKNRIHYTNCIRF